MGINLYWRHQRAIDTILAGLYALASHCFFGKGYKLFLLTSSSMVDTAKEAFSASVSLFGLVAATVAFVFSAIDSDKFRILRESKSQRQMWDIFSFTLICLFLSSVWSFIIIIHGGTAHWSQFVIDLSTFLITLVFILTLKFTWVMVQIIAVKAS